METLPRPSETQLSFISLMEREDHQAGLGSSQSQVIGKDAFQDLELNTKTPHNGCPLSPRLPAREALLADLNEAK